MKILLTAINARYTHSNLSNLYLRKLLVDEGFSPLIAEFSINQAVLEITQQIVIVKPDIVSFSIYIWNRQFHEQILMDLKKYLPETIILIGGPEVSYNSGYWLANFPDVNYVCVGFGENCLTKLMLSNFEYPTRIVNGHDNQPQIDFPYDKKVLSVLSHKYIYYEASRGCPFRCSYCLSSREDSGLQQRKLEDIEQDLRFFIDNQVKIVKFIDRSFNADKNFARSIWKFLIEHSAVTKFHFEIYPQNLEEEDFFILEKVRSGLFQFEIGIQSIHHQTLSEIKRPSSWEVIREKINRLQKTKIHLHVDQIVGLPQEDFQAIKSSFNHIYKLDADHFQMGFLKVLAGTEMAEKATEYELSYSEIPPYQIIKNKWLQVDEIIKLEKVAHLMEALKNSHKFDATIDFLVGQYHSPFDFWSDLAEYYFANNLSVHVKWMQTAENFLNFSQNNIVLDKLRWDWHLLANAHYYPEKLSSSKLIDLKKKNFAWVKERFSKLKITPKTLKKAIFYQTEDENLTTVSFNFNNQREIYRLNLVQKSIKKVN